MAHRNSDLVKGRLNLLISSADNMKRGNEEFDDAIPKKREILVHNLTVS